MKTIKTILQLGLILTLLAAIGCGEEDARLLDAIDDIDVVDSFGDLDEPDDITTTDTPEEVPDDTVEQVDTPVTFEDTFEPYDVPAEENLAWVWAHPNDTGKDPPDMEPLPHITTSDGSLTGMFANVFNCINKPGGISVTEYAMGGEITISLCVLEQTVSWDIDGNYLSVRPPQNMKDPNDAFAEVQVYYHINRIHDYFSEVIGIDTMDKPLRAIVNLQGGLVMSGITSWIPIDNAAFVPKESLRQLGHMFDVALPFDEDVLIFGQGEIDFSYDGDVVYHEYTHAVIGPERLWADRADRFGIDTSPLSINEALADYYPATFTDDPVGGRWALGAFDLARDISIEATCPRDIVGESHDDSMVASSAFWKIRELLGPEVADLLIFDAISSSTYNTNFDEFAQFLIAEAAFLNPPMDTEIEAILQTHGMIGCDRVRQLSDMTPSDVTYVPGIQTAGLLAFSQYIPGYNQFRLTVPEGTAAVKLTWEILSNPTMDMLASLTGESTDVDMQLALKAGSDPIFWDYVPKTTHDAHSQLPVQRNDKEYTALFAGNCLSPGDHVFQFLVTSDMGGAITSIQAEFLTEVPANASDYQCAVE